MNEMAATLSPEPRELHPFFLTRYEGYSPSREETPLALFLLVLGLAASIAGGYLSRDGIFHYDDLTHYLYAKWSWQIPAYLLDDWGRPGFTILYFLPAKISWTACRVWSAILSGAAAWFGFRSAQQLGIRGAWAVVLLTFLQPLFFQLSETTLTETALAFYFTLAVYLALCGRWTISSFILSLCFVTRHESIIFLPLWVGLALFRGVPIVRLLPTLWAPIALNIATWASNLSIPIVRMLEPKPNTQYGEGSLFGFFARALVAWGPGITVLAMTGFVDVIRRRGGLLVAGSIVAYFGAHTIIRVFGLFASGGYSRFLVPVAPLISICAVAGWMQLTSGYTIVRTRSILLSAAFMIFLWLCLEREFVFMASHPEEGLDLPGLYPAKLAMRISTGVVVVAAIVSAIRSGASRPGDLTRMLVPECLALLMAVACYGICGPLKRPALAGTIDQTITDLREMGLSDRKILSANVWLDWASGRSVSPQRPPLRQEIEEAPLGTLFAWEKQFAGSQDHDLELNEFLASDSFRLVYTAPSPSGDPQPSFWIFEKTRPWEPIATTSVPVRGS